MLSWTIDVSRVPGFAAKAAKEDAKLDEDFMSASPVSQQVHGGRHRLVPFVLEEGGGGGGVGDHASCLKLPSSGPRRASSRCQSRGPAPTPRLLLGTLVEARGLWVASSHFV